MEFQPEDLFTLGVEEEDVGVADCAREYIGETRRLYHHVDDIGVGHQDVPDVGGKSIELALVERHRDDAGDRRGAAWRCARLLLRHGRDAVTQGGEQQHGGDAENDWVSP